MQDPRDHRRGGRHVLRVVRARQRARHRDDGARPRRVPAADLHPDPDRRSQRQRRPGAVRRDQRLPAAARPPAAPHPEDPRQDLGLGLGHPRLRQPLVRGGPEVPRRVDGLHPARRARLPGEGSGQARGLAEAAAAVRRDRAPELDAHRPRGPDPARAGRPDPLHAARRGPVPGRPRRALQERVPAT